MWYAEKSDSLNTTEAKPENLFFYGKDIYFGDDGIAFRVNNAFYGLRISNRFFDSLTESKFAKF